MPKAALFRVGEPVEAANAEGGGTNWGNREAASSGE